MRFSASIQNGRQYKGETDREMEQSDEVVPQDIDQGCDEPEDNDAAAEQAGLDRSAPSPLSFRAEHHVLNVIVIERGDCCGQQALHDIDAGTATGNRTLNGTKQQALAKLGTDTASLDEYDNSV